MSEKKINPAKGLLEALKFIKPAQKKTGSVQQQFCVIENNYIIASNEILTIGAPIQEDLTACPHSFKFEEALKKVSDDLSITQLSELSLSVTSGVFKGFVSCVPKSSLETSAPDENVAAIDDTIKHVCKLFAPLASESSSIPHYASLLLQANSAAATDGKVLMEFWHGTNLPPNMLIPKQAASAIAKSKKALTGFGYGGSSATFWFEDESFIKTQLFEAKYPNYIPQFATKEEIEPVAIPEAFFPAVKAIKSFSKTGMVYFKDGKLSSDHKDEEASVYEVDGLPFELAFNSKHLLIFQKEFQKVIFEKPVEIGDMCKGFFFGNKVRGVVLGMKKEEVLND